MATWWYFKQSVYADMHKQTEAAMSIEYDTNKAADWWLGTNPLAANRSGSRGIDDVVQSLEANTKKRISRPVKAGDTVWVYNIRCLGSTLERILFSLRVCHSAGIHLRIYTLQYHDIDSTNDYFLLSGALKELNQRSENKKKKKGAGRPEREIHISDISLKGLLVLRDYDAKNGKYTRKSAIDAMQGTPKDGGVVSKKLFYQLLNEFRKMKLTAQIRGDKK